MGLREDLQRDGFSGFATRAELRRNRSALPNREGVYVVFYAERALHVGETKRSLNERLAELISPAFSGHRGGKLWLHSDPDSLTVCWKVTAAHGQVKRELKSRLGLA